jgi:hypothetical protein
MKLYKYISSAVALKNIVSGNIKFATVSELNDPTELLANLTQNKFIESLSNLRKTGYDLNGIEDLKKQEELFRILSNETMIIKAPTSIEQANQTIKLDIYDNFEYMRKQFNKTIDLMSNRCGIFCVSSRFNSLPMWAHYAKNAKGFVIEFNELENYFNENKTGILNKLEKVYYTKTRSGVTFEAGSYKSVFFEKNSDWKYEEEYRVISDLSSCIKTIDNIFVKVIPIQLITKIIFGWKLNPEEIESIQNDLIAINDKLEFSIASVKNGYIEIR